MQNARWLGSLSYHDSSRVNVDSPAFRSLYLWGIRHIVLEFIMCLVILSVLFSSLDGVLIFACSVVSLFGATIPCCCCLNYSGWRFNLGIQIIVTIARLAFVIFACIEGFGYGSGDIQAVVLILFCTIISSSSAVPFILYSRDKLFSRPVNIVPVDDVYHFESQQMQLADAQVVAPVNPRYVSSREGEEHHHVSRGAGAEESHEQEGPQLEAVAVAVSQPKPRWSVNVPTANAMPVNVFEAYDYAPAAVSVPSRRSMSDWVHGSGDIRAVGGGAAPAVEAAVGRRTLPFLHGFRNATATSVDRSSGEWVSAGSTNLARRSSTVSAVEVAGVFVAPTRSNSVGAFMGPLGLERIRDEEAEVGGTSVLGASTGIEAGSR